MIRFRFLVLALALPVVAFAADPAPKPDDVLMERAQKIVAQLELTDNTLARKITERVAQQYANLRVVHEKRDTAIAAARQLDDEAAGEAAVKAARDEASAQQAHLHYSYISHLAAELTPPQVEAIKDGMTYGVVPLTFGVYQKMMPDLTPEQKTQILAWLMEAREHAMDAGSSKEKHGWFGKYKGKINNYLSAAGYNLKEAEKNLR